MRYEWLLALTVVGCVSASASAFAQPVDPFPGSWRPSAPSVQTLHSDQWITIEPEVGVTYDVPAASPTGMFYIERSKYDGTDAQMNRITDRLAKGLMIEAACERFQTEWESTDLTPALFPSFIRSYVKLAIARGDKMKLSVQQCESAITEWNHTK